MSTPWTLGGSTSPYFAAGVIGTTTGNWPIQIEPERELIYEKEYEVSKIVKRHANKDYFYVISVSDTDDVFYQIWKGGWFSLLLFKAMGNRNGYKKKNVNDRHNTQWDAVRKRTHLPATIGATYLEIDDAIKKHIEESKVASDHDNYAEKLLKTEPDNLKMIQGLEKLAEGEPDETGAGTGIMTSITQGNVSVGSPTNITGSGGGAFYVRATPTSDLRLPAPTEEAYTTSTDDTQDDEFEDDHWGTLISM